MEKAIRPIKIFEVNISGLTFAGITCDMLTDDRTPTPKKSLRRQMTVTLSIAIVTLILLVALPMGFLSIRLQREETGRMHQDMVNRIADDMSQILQDLQTNQLQISLNAPSNSNGEENSQSADINYIVPQIVNLRNLTILRIAAQTQNLLEADQPLDQLLENNARIVGIQLFTTICCI